jgi:tetratricopeptide (TPR) repeat protein
MQEAFAVLAGRFPNHASGRLHSCLGNLSIQRAHNHVQMDQLVEATGTLATWQPSVTPSKMETVVLFRRHILLGKICRHQGNFNDSLNHLKRARHIASDCQGLTFFEDEKDLTCSFADTFLELDDPISGEECLRLHIKHHGPTQAGIFIALSEALFAQKRFKEAEQFSHKARALRTSSAIEEVRLFIAQAKICHVNLQLDQAFIYWTSALRAVRAFPLADGHATRIILQSQSDILRQQGRLDVQKQTLAQFEAVVDAGSKGATFWIPGLRRWLDDLQGQIAASERAALSSSIKLPPPDNYPKHRW